MRRVAGETLRPGGFVLTDRGALLAGLAPGQVVLDVGCGTGATVRRLRSRYGARAVGLDARISEAGSLAAGTLPLARGLAQALPFAEGAFQALFCECVLSLLPDRKAALAEFRRVLLPDGVLVLSDLYQRIPESAGGASGSCADSAPPLPDVVEQVRGAGFRVRIVEDHSALLRDLSARLVWAGEPVTNQGRCAGSAGYYLLLADVVEESHAG